jgi:UDP-glucose 4-epimerase
VSLEEQLRGARIVVTGGCGFIGSHLVRRLSELDAAEIGVLDDLRGGSRENIAGLDDRVQVRTLPLDGSSPAQLRDALTGVDHLFHLAAVKSNDPARGSEEILRTNVLGTYQLFDAAARAGVSRVVFSSSLYAYGRMTGPRMREDEPALPVTVYGASKLAGERLLHALAAKGGPAFNVLRYFFAYGPGPSRESSYRSVITRTVNRLLAGENAVVHGDGLQVLDYVYVGDIVEATLLAATSETVGEVLNVCTGTGARVIDLLREIQVAAGHEGDPIERAPADETDGTSRVGDPRRCEDLLGFSASTSLSEGLGATVEAARRAGMRGSR